MLDVDDRRRWLTISRSDLRTHQLARIRAVLTSILPTNRFYQAKLGDQPRLDRWEDLANLPLTTKEELVLGATTQARGTARPGFSGDRIRAEGPEDFAANRTFPVSDYVRFHRTSGTRGRPLVLLDRAEDWGWWNDAWQFVFDAGGITPTDRVFLAFSFGPFIGFWTAFDAAIARGCLVIPGGGLSTAARLDLIRTSDATVLCATPTYAQHLADTAAEMGVDLRSTSVKTIVVAGEPGGSLPAVRNRLESAWDATVLDHAGATEVGPWGFGTPDGQDLYVNEQAFWPEFLVPGGTEPADEGDMAELILTTLGREGSPVIRYRTGDLVRPHYDGGIDQGRGFVRLAGGVLSRADDMLIIRGVNIFPSSIEEILRRDPDVAEFRIIAHRRGAMDDLKIEVEDQRQDPERIMTSLAIGLGLRVEVTCVPRGSLPRSELKARRFVDQRDN